MSEGTSRRMKVDVLGCVRNTPVPKDRALLPIFEAVVNGIHSTDERFGGDVGKRGLVEVRLRRAAQERLPGAAGTARSSA